MKIKQNVILAKHTTYKIGGPADYFIGVKNIDELKQALKFADDNALPKFILAGGSNVLFSDEGYRGLIIKIDSKKINIAGNKITADAGALMNDLVSQSIENGLAGLEWAGGLPGTIGGAIRGNAGCFGGETKDAVVEVMAMTENGEIKKYSGGDCGFEYRDSAFKHNGEIILSAVFKLKSGDREKLKAEVFDHIKYRKTKHRMPSCGSVFKNISGMPAGAIIEACGLKGKAIGGARITEEHSNIIHNFNNAKATDVLELINLAKEKVDQKFGIKLEEEVQLML
ncbi:MAG: UDP-N-acetylenolpyruvoylglucosamine reductase [Candidatus Azambacteria bacterium GW2011_GWE1_42_9]|nr:MAG: UDP-N-acetylenolpyruvoylglucosamine reductase [Candidatus Azambacteria bacterium GW2011_GWF1_41_10]KKS49151.1 MAG: UDP-N-acetylenolpyruvoylglucosamine reductase [Candidatus Azambacteria bacterium GW2011_GWF2_42_22]KKS79723.1 MAG: UDP-N-acetylenolpyruvoylglucosamine reductase [Candidatus Azambacteria bacterium GW2011_GWE1_42_9]KKT03270.1 MAG: UDP-N-acetylenolpyruvoylglucosamine reductase [Candidatus Azambacteria bacterium GW2011_GWD1_43_18]KKT12653.1 MAG: UDP-N-acetylenolpyruvoylglucosam